MKDHHYQLTQKLSPTLFRAYDIRGLVESEITEDGIYTLGYVLGQRAFSLGETTLRVGRDGRDSGVALSRALMAGINDAGCAVNDIGMVPTPVLYFATQFSPYHSGVIVTASHNPAPYNGLKMVLKGRTLCAEDIQQLRTAIEQLNLSATKPAKVGGHTSDFSWLSQYQEYISSRYRLTKTFKVVVDCGNGVAGLILPQLLRSIGVEVIELYCEVDGRFPNHDADPSQPENLVELQAKVLAEKADVGIAMDGDGDRIGLVTNQGAIIWPDRQMMLFAKDILSRNARANIIFDVKCSRFLREIISKHGGNPIMARTGHSLVKAKMLEMNALLAGEMSGHIFFKENWFGFDDGMYTAVRFLDILSRYDATAHELFLREIPDSFNTPELKIKIAENQKQMFMQEFMKKAQFSEAQCTLIDGLRADFAYGFGLLRSSNTSAYLVSRFEADSKENLQKIQRLFRNVILEIDGSLELPF